MTRAISFGKARTKDKDKGMGSTMVHIGDEIMGEISPTGAVAGG